jgi:galactose mutarotase-like enzyme
VGKTSQGATIRRYTMTNRQGASVSILNLGATIASLRVPDRDGRLEDVVLGYASAEDYLRNAAYYGATVGRYANRIVGSKLVISGRQYPLSGKRRRAAWRQQRLPHQTVECSADQDLARFGSALHTDQSRWR